MALEVIDLTDKILECIAQESNKYLPRYIKGKKRTKKILKTTKGIGFIEGPIGSGKSTATEALANELDILALLEKPEDPRIKRYLAMLYSKDPETKSMGAENVNNTYLAFRMEQYQRALTAAQSVLLDRIATADLLYMQGFIEDRLMTPEQVAEITRRRTAESSKLRGTSLLTAPKEFIVLFTGTPELFYRRKNNRARDVEIEEDGRGVPLWYIKRLTDFYDTRFAKILEDEGFRGPLVRVPQEVKPDIEFEPTNGRHTLPLMEFIIDYLS